jgi:hypothetical protein
MKTTKRVLVALFILAACSRSGDPSPCTGKPEPKPPEQPEKG